MPTAVTELRQRLAEISDLSRASSVLHWDQNVTMPAHGAEQRAQALATLARIEHERFIAAETGRLLEAAATEVQGQPEDTDDVRIVRKAQRDYDKASRVPADLAAELARGASEGRAVWIAARAANDFQMFLPALRHNLELKRRYVDCFEGYDVAYDVLLDDYDAGTTTADVTRLFSELRDQLVPLIAQLRDRDIDTSIKHVPYGVAGQRRLVDEVLRRMSFNDEGWRMDDTVHPFATSFGVGDVRITTRYEPDYFPMALYGAMHECGHGLYSGGVDPSLERTVLGHLDSLAIHESQSRMWENFVGRSRQFTDWLTPRLVDHAGGSLNALGTDGLFRAVNAVTPSLIRIEADETTYGLHVVVRFELEQQMIDGTLDLADLPEAWNAKMRDYLGVEVTSDADGVLQDTHWAIGLLGYFPTYALGNLIAGQLWERLRKDLPHLDAQLEAGELDQLLAWLREHVHRHGSKYTSGEMLQRVVGEPIAVGPFISYLKAKLSDVYELSLA